MTEQLPNKNTAQESKTHQVVFASDTASGAKLFLWFFMIMLIFSLYLLYQVMAPFFHSIILACIFTALCYPLYKWFLSRMRGHKIPAALLVLFVLTVVIAIPVTFFIVGLIPEAIKSVAMVNQWLAGQHLGELINTHLDPLFRAVDQHFPELEVSSIDIRGGLLSASRNAGQILLSSGTYLVANTMRIGMHLMLILLMMFYLLLSGPSLVKQVEYLFPLKPRHTSIVIESLRRMARSVFVGGLLVAVLQGIVGGIGFSILGIPGLFWGTLMVFAALVPVVGTGLVWIPAICVQLLMGETTNALILLIWCGVGVTSIDSFLRPFLLKDGAPVPMLFLFLAILGGIQAFGMLGILYGPMILGFVAVMIAIYAEEYYSILSNRSRSDDSTCDMPLEAPSFNLNIRTSK